MKILRLSFLSLISLAIAVAGVQAKSLPPQFTSAAPPLYFIENQGQIDPAVRFYEQAASHAMYFTHQGVQLNFKGADRSGTVRLSPVAANPSPRLSAENQRDGKINYLLGNDKKKWRTDVPTFGAVRYENVYDGIDLKFYGIEKTLEYDVIVKPGASPDTVQLSYDGIQGMRLTASGELEISLKNGLLTHQKPYIYQTTDGVKTEIAGHFRIISADRKNGFVYGFEVAEYDQEKELIIDPILLFGSYIGSGSLDNINDVAIDASGNMYITGQAFANNYPLAGQLYAYSGSYDAIISCINPDTGTLLWSTYYGGLQTDSGAAIALDPTGNVYVTGTTSSTDFPMPVAGYQTTKQGAATMASAYLIKLNNAGNTVLYSTFFGGGFADNAQGIALDSANNAHIVGYSQSTNLPMINSYLATNPGSTSAFIAKFDTSQTGAGSLLYSSWLGGTSSDYGHAVTICDFDYTYITGGTLSTDFSTYPIVQSSSGGMDAFVAVFNTSASIPADSLQGSYLFGGTLDDAGNGIAVNAGAINYITGNTYSANFPVTTVPAPLYNSLIGTSDAFVTKINPFSGIISYSTFLGGEINESGQDIVLDAAETTVSVIGETTSSEAWFPLVNPTYNTAGVGNDLFITQLSATDATLTYSTFVGGSGQDYGTGIAVDTNGNIYFAGYSNSTDLPLVGQYSAHVFDYDGFIGKLGEPPFVPDITVTDTSLPNNDLTVNYNAVVTGSFADAVITIVNDGTDYLSIGSIPGSSSLVAPFSFPAATDGCSGTMVMPAGSCQFTVRFSPTVAQVYNATVVIDSNDPDENPVNVSLSGFGVGAPDITVPSAVDFGTILRSDVFGEQTFTVKNDGGSDLTISSVVITSGTAYAIWLDNCIEGTLPPAGSCDITVRFTPPASLITYIDTVQITSNDPDESPIAVSLSGTAVDTPTPALEAIDSVVPDNDNNIDFGITTVNTPVSEVVTVRNIGMVGSNTTISGVGTLQDPLNLPYTITNDTCTNTTLIYNSTCSFNVVFTPTVAGTSFPETFRIVSGVNPITITVNGSATIAEKAEIVATDDSGTTNDRIISFGDLTVGQSATSTVTITNLGTGGSVLGIYNVAVIDPLSAPFGLITDNCTGQTLPYNSACTMTIEFAPTSVGTFGQMFDIPNSDGDTPDNPVFITVNGNGVAPLVPDITVSDANGLLADTSTIDFGQVAIGSSVSHPVTISSAGGTTSLDNLLISSLTTPFAVTSNCPASLGDGSSCTATVTYTPTTAGVDNDSLSISSNDPDEGLIVLNVTGTATLANNPPPAPRAIYPVDKSSGLPTALNLRWESVTDTDGDTLTYELYISSDPSFTEETPVLINVSSTTPSDGNILYAGIGGASALLLLCCAPFINRRRRELMVVAACVVLLSCGGASDDPVKSRDGYTNVTINLGGMQQALNIRAQTASPAPEYVDHVVVKVTGPDIDPVLSTVQAGSFAVLEVPNGPLRLFDARAFSNSGVEVFYTPTPSYADLDGTPLALALYLNERSNGSYPVSGLLPATTYYWKVVVSDGQTPPVESPVYSFTTQ